MERETDWALLWRQLVEKRTHGLSGKPQDPWEGRARTFDAHVKKRWEREDSSRNFMVELLKAHPDSTVLDVGAGAGAWVCLMAPHAAHITALEPSSAMIAMMRGNLGQTGLSNVRITQGSWPGAEVEQHDFSICSHAMYDCLDLPAFVRRMEAVSRRGCVLLLRAPAPDGVMAELAREIWGHPHDSANFQVAYNCLLQMGIFANVIMEEGGPWKTWSHPSLEEACREVKDRLRLGDDQKYDLLIKNKLKERLVLQDDRYIWPSGVRSALIYWLKR